MMRTSIRSLLIVLALCAGVSSLLLLPLEAGGPLTIGGAFGVPGEPFRWNINPINYWTDQGNLGNQTNTDANNLVQEAFAVWGNVSSATVSFSRDGSLSQDITASNILALFNRQQNCGVPLQDAKEARTVIYDVDGSALEALGSDPNSVLGFAGAVCVGTDGVNNIFTRGRALLNGKFLDGVNTPSNPETTVGQFKAVVIHENGHFLGLDHSQINLQCLPFPFCATNPDALLGLPTMFPVLVNGDEMSTLAPDDIAALSALYPAASFATSFGTIRGRILFSDGATPAQGFNVIARREDNPSTSQNESLRTALSSVSGYLFTGNPGQSISGTNTGGSSFGSRDESLIGVYEILGVPPGNYTVEVEEINTSISPPFVGGSSVGPFDAFQFPLPGPAEFYSGGQESASDNPAGAGSTVGAVAGTVTNNIDIILNGTPPRFDQFETPVARNDTPASATSLGFGTHRGSISPFADNDFYSFSATAGNEYDIEITSQRLNPERLLDSVIEIVNPNGTRLNTCGSPSFSSACLNDDIQLGVVTDSKLAFRAAASGTFVVHVLDFRGDGRPELEYDLEVTDLTGGGGGGQLALSISSGNNQTGTVGTELPNPLVVLVQDNSTPSSGVQVTFAAASGGGSVSPTTATTDSNGLAQTTATLGPNPGTNTFTATISGSTTVTFSATATQTTVSPLPTANFVTTIPHSASGGGFLTSLFVSNLVNNSNPITINRINQSGVVVESTTTTLQPGATFFEAGNAADRTASLTVEWFAIGSDFPIAASVLFDFDSESLGLAENFRTAVGALASEPLSAFTLPVRVATVEVTVGIALANLSDASNSLTLNLLNENGTVVATDSLTLDPFEQTAFSLQDRQAFNSIILGVPEFVGALAITTDNPSQTVAAMVIGNNVRQLYSLPVSSGVAQ